MKYSNVFDLSVSRIGVGTVQFGTDYGINNTVGKVSYQDVLTVLSRAIDAGVNFLDTARGYGTSEETIGRAIAEIGHDGFVICTKLDLPSGYEHLSDRAVTAAVNESLERSLDALGVDHVPIYLLHNYSYKTFRHGLVWNTVLEHVQAGLIRYPGISIGVGPEEALNAMEDESVRVLQIPFNILDGRWQRCGVFEKAVQRKVALFGRSAYLQGLALMEPSAVQTRLPRAVPFVQALREMATNNGLEIKDLVLGYALTEPFLFSSVVGVDSPTQLEENLMLAERAFSGEQVDMTGNFRLTVNSRFADVPETVLNPALWGNGR